MSTVGRPSGVTYANDTILNPPKGAESGMDGVNNRGSDGSTSATGENDDAQDSLPPLHPDRADPSNDRAGRPGDVESGSEGRNDRGGDGDVDGDGKNGGGNGRYGSHNNNGRYGTGKFGDNGNPGNNGNFGGNGNVGGGHYQGSQSGLISGLGDTLGHLTTVLFGDSPTDRWQPQNPSAMGGQTPRSGGEPNNRVPDQPSSNPPNPSTDSASQRSGVDHSTPMARDGARADAPGGDVHDVQGQIRDGKDAATRQGLPGQQAGTASGGTAAGSGAPMAQTMAGAAMLAGMPLAAGLAEQAAAQTPQQGSSTANAAQAAQSAAEEAVLANQQNAQLAKDALLAQARSAAGGANDATQLRQPANDPRSPTQLADPRRSGEALDPSLAKSTADAQARSLVDPRLADARLAQALVRGEGEAKQLQSEAAEKAKNANLADSARAVNGDESKMRARLALAGGTLTSTAASARQMLDWVGQQVREFGFDAKEGSEGVRAMRVVAGLIAASVVVLVVIALLYALRVILVH